MQACWVNKAPKGSKQGSLLHELQQESSRCVCDLRPQSAVCVWVAKQTQELPPWFFDQRNISRSKLGRVCGDYHFKVGCC